MSDCGANEHSSDLRFSIVRRSLFVVRRSSFGVRCSKSFVVVGRRCYGVNVSIDGHVLDNLLEE